MPLLALTRELTPAIVRCELTHVARAPINVARAREQHATYEATLHDLGCRVERITADPSMADAVFIEDTAVIVDELAVITRPGAASRRAETDGVAAALRPYRPIAAIAPPGTLDGGDVLRIGRRLFVGIGARSDANGVAQLRALLAPMGYAVTAVPFHGCLHLKTAVTLVGEEVIVVNRHWVEPSAFGPLRIVDVDAGEPYAANALRVRGAVIHHAGFARTRARLEAAGLMVVPVPADELAKAEGGVTCCSLLLDM